MQHYLIQLYFYRNCSRQDCLQVPRERRRRKRRVEEVRGKVRKGEERRGKERRGAEMRGGEGGGKENKTRGEERRRELLLMKVSSGSRRSHTEAQTCRSLLLDVCSSNDACLSRPSSDGACCPLCSPALAVPAEFISLISFVLTGSRGPSSGRRHSKFPLAEYKYVSTPLLEKSSLRLTELARAGKTQLFDPRRKQK